MSDPVTDPTGQIVQPRNITHVGGTAQTARDWSGDMSKLDIALSALRDAIEGAGDKNFTTLDTLLAAKLDIALSVLRDALKAASLGDNRKTVTTAGTAVALAASTACQWVIVTAETDNTGKVVAGGSTVVAALATRRGVPLDPGDSVVIPVDNLADVYIDSEVSGDGVTFMYGV